MRRPSVVRSLFLAMMATGLAMGLMFPFVVAPFAEFRSGLRLTFSVLCVVAGLVVGALNFLLVRTFLLRNVERVSGQLAALASGQGISAKRISLDSADALGRLVKVFNDLIDRLRATLRRVTETLEAFVAHAGQTGQAAQQLVASADRKSQVVSGTATLFEGLRQEFGTVGEVFGRLKDSAAESRAAVVAQARQIDAVNTKVAALQGRSQEGAGAMERTVSALRRTGAFVEELRAALDSAAASMTQIDTTVRAIDGNLSESTGLAEGVATDAVAGDRAVSSTREAMERIRDGFVEAESAITELGRRVTEISAVTSVIEEVTDQTGLLALNAAIIAAQAGQHGRGFGVVAEQIKTLASRTAKSTHEIDGIVGSFRAQVTAVLESVARNRARVEDGVALSGKAADALGSIRESAGSSLRHVQAIGRSTSDIAASTHELSETVESIAARVREISVAGDEQGREIAALQQTVADWRQASAAIFEATREQAQQVQRFERQLETVSGLVEKSMAAIHEGHGQTNMLAATIETLQDLDVRERGHFGSYEAEAGTLAQQAQALRQEIERLRPDDAGAGAAAGEDRGRR